MDGTAGRGHDAWMTYSYHYKFRHRKLLTMLYYDRVTDAADALGRSERLRAYVADAPAFAGREALDGTLRDIVRVVCARIAAEKALESIA